MKTLYYPGQRTGAFGWATCNRHLSKALEAHFRPVHEATNADVVFMPIADHDLNPMTQERGKITVGYTFFESELGPLAAENAKRYDLIFCGSTWCKERLAERGILHKEVLIQGVDRSVFFPTKRQRKGPIRIFSGGKFEYRKGQDLVIEAFRLLLEKEPDAHLVCAWHNPWLPLVVDAIHRSGLKKPAPFTVDSMDVDVAQCECYRRVLLENGIRESQFTILPKLGHIELANEMRDTDLGVFPNRCEGGTNLVLMEYAACGRPVVANFHTGHRDVFDLIDMPIDAEDDEKHWAVQSPESIVESMEGAIRRLGEPVNRSGYVPEWWEAAEKVKTAIDMLVAAEV